MHSFLLQPYPFNENPVRKLVLCAGIGLFIVLFLGVFKPFGFDNLPAGKAWSQAFLFGGITFIVSSLFQILLPLIFTRPFKEEGWRSWKEIVYLLVTTLGIGAGNYLLSLYLYPQDVSLQNFFWSELTALEVGVFPVLFVVFLKQLRLYRRFSAEAKEVTEDIHIPKREAAGVENIFVPAIAVSKKEKESPPSTFKAKQVDARLVLRGDNQNEELPLLPEDLLYLTSADNYVNVLYREGGSSKSSLLRGSLKGFEEQLNNHPIFFRCHRMYIVNLQKVTDVSGNAQGLKLHLTGSDEAIPVSRNLTETVKEKLHVLSRSPLGVNGQ